MAFVLKVSVLGIEGEEEVMVVAAVAEVLEIEIVAGIAY
jgi:hypothetical protein